MNRRAPTLPAGPNFGASQQQMIVADVPVGGKIMQQQQQDAMLQQHDQTALWAQQSYFLDSGIQTAAVPTASSVLSGVSGGGASTNGMLDDHMDNMYAPSSYVGGGSGYTQDQINGFNADYEATRAYRIRAAMFPETLDQQQQQQQQITQLGTGGPTGAPSFDFGQSTNVQRLTEPGQMLKMAVVNIVNYQEDAALTKKVIPDLVELLTDKDSVVAEKAAQFVHHISKIDAMSSVLAAEPNLLKAVLSLTNSKDSSTIKHVVGTLYNLSNGADGRLAIFRSGGIEALIKLLNSPVDSVVYYAITTLHNLILHQPGAPDAVRRAGGVAEMAKLLKTKSLEKFLAILIDCLYNLALNNQDTKNEILRMGGTTQLIQILNSHDYEKLLWTTTRLLQALSICTDNKRAIIANGGLQALARRLAHPSQRLVRTLLLVLRNLSDAAVQDENVEQLLIGVLQLMGSSDIEVVLCCAGILSNMSCNNIRNKATIHRNGGVNYLLRIIETYEPMFGANPQCIGDLLESALCTLRHVTARHPEAEVAQNELRLYRSSSGGTGAPNSVPVHQTGLHLMARFTDPNVPWPMTLVRPALGVVRNVANLPANAQPLYELGLAANVCTILMRFYGQIQHAQRQNVPPPLIDGSIKCGDVVDTCASVLQALCKFAPNRSYVRQTNVVPILVQLLYFDMDTVQQFAAGTLTEIAAEPEGCQLIEQNGAVPQLTELLHSRNENIATYAAAVLHALSRSKPAEYQQHLGVELTSSLFRDDSTPWGQDVLSDMPQVNEDMFDTYNGNFADPPPSNYDFYATQHNPGGNLMDYDMGMPAPGSGSGVPDSGAPPPHYSSAPPAPIHHHQHHGGELGGVGGGRYNPPIIADGQHHLQRQQGGPGAGGPPAPNNAPPPSIPDWYDTNL